MTSDRSTQAAPRAALGLSVAVIQPYLYPYPGYFRLLARADLFVICGCEQLLRRGRAHRCEVPDPCGAIEWRTLPLSRQARATCICDLAFAPRARQEFDRRIARLPWIAAGNGATVPRFGSRGLTGRGTTVHANY